MENIESKVKYFKFTKNLYFNKILKFQVTLID
jgi:hypothetical protein